ncbi:hypothetical protein [Almyronema epifaneia]|uniref:Uncharacterized protein n=1 Tax=Almyronema epifaneia S1 TaxID=2991925 RepID=A0ABW6IDJ8_9CYAN
MTAMPSDEAIIWQCEAAGAERSYQVETLDMAAAAFAVKIFGDATYETLVETVQVQPATAAAGVWVGYTATGQVLTVRPLASNLEFAVEETPYGRALGRCIRHTAFN